MTEESSSLARPRDFPIKVMGRTLEHLGTQLYKRRDAALAELVANAWDAGATEVSISIPTAEGYAQATSELVIADNGEGMDEDAVENDYLVVGRNRRLVTGDSAPRGRKPMGRKGIGKLAGFGLAKMMRVETWTEGGETTSLTLDVEDLKRPAGETDEAKVPGEVRPGSPDDAEFSSGTRLTLTNLKHPSPPDSGQLRESLARRFSRSVRGEMTIFVNAEPVEEPTFELELRHPLEKWETVQLDDDTSIRYWYGFSPKPIPTTLLRGWTILVRGKTAQTGNFFFGVEGTASGQHGTKYLTGVIEADDLDSGTDDESDIVSTDRQELDWDDPRTAALRAWGDATTRKALRDRSGHRGRRTRRRIMELADFKRRVERLDVPSQKRVGQYLERLGEADADDERTVDLADQLILAFEYQHFHDLVGQIDEAEDPDRLAELLGHLSDWKVLESRAILEIVNGRLRIVDTYQRLLDENAPETPRANKDNLHDLLADYPWLIHPEWQVLAEEKRISTQLQEWGAADVDVDDRQRYDFLALKGEGELIVIEIKRSQHPVELVELQRLEQYKVKLESSQPAIRMVFISGGNFAFNEEGWRERDDIDILTWAEIHHRTRLYYEHYRAVLEGDVTHGDFSAKQAEVQRTRHVLEQGTARGVERRAEGLGNQDAKYDE